MRVKIIIGLVAMCLTMAFTINNDFAQILIEKMQQFKQQSPQVKLFLFFNQTTYMPEDTAYFSVRFLTEDMIPVSGRQVVRVELLNQTGELVYFQNVSVKDGVGANQVVIPAGLKAGVYRWVAYSDWMKNFHKQFYFKHDFVLVVKNDFVKNENDDSLKLSFHPEGGTLVSSISNQVVIRSNKFISVIRIVNEKGEEIVRGTSSMSRYFNLTITPQPGMHYYAEAEYKGNIQRFSLSGISHSGVAMNLSLEQSIVRLKLSVPRDSKLREENLWLVVSAHSDIYFTAALKFESKEFLAMNFPLEGLPPGICYATVLNERGEVFAERVFAGNSTSEVKAEVHKSKETVDTRSKIQFEIRLLDENDQPLAGEFSMSVLHKKFSNTLFPSVSISKYFLLNSDLVMDDAPDYLTGSELDLFLITQKNYRINWKSVLEQNFSNAYSFKRMIQYSGRAVDIETRNPLPDSSMVIAYLQKGLMGYETMVRKDGSFDLPFILDFWNEDEIFYTVQNKSGKEVKALINWSNDSTSTDKMYLSFREVESISGYSTFQTNNRLINRSFRFYKSGTRSSYDNPLIDPNFIFEDEFSGADFDIKLDEYVVFPTMEELIREVIPNLQHRKVKGKPAVRVLLPDVGAAPDGPLYIIDGIMTRDSDYFLQLKTTDIIYIKVVKEYSKLLQMGSMARNGVVLVLTKGVNHDELKRTNTMLSVKGLNRAIPFHVVDHSGSDDERTPDFRSTLYWNPSVKLKTDGTAEVNFSASDDVGTLLIHIQGITADGRPFQKLDSLSVVFHKN